MVRRPGQGNFQSVHAPIICSFSLSYARAGVMIGPVMAARMNVWRGPVNWGHGEEEILRVLRQAYASRSARSWEMNSKPTDLVKEPAILEEHFNHCSSGTTQLGKDTTKVTADRPYADMQNLSDNLVRNPASYAIYGMHNPRSCSRTLIASSPHPSACTDRQHATYHGNSA